MKIVTENPKQRSFWNIKTDNDRLVTIIEFAKDLARDPRHQFKTDAELIRLAFQKTGAK